MAFLAINDLSLHQEEHSSKWALPGQQSSAVSRHPLAGRLVVLQKWATPRVRMTVGQKSEVPLLIDLPRNCEGFLWFDNGAIRQK